MADVLSFTSPQEEPFTTYEHNCIVELFQQTARHDLKLFSILRSLKRVFYTENDRMFKKIRRRFPFLEDIKYGHVPIKRGFLVYLCIVYSDKYWVSSFWMVSRALLKILPLSHSVLSSNGARINRQVLFPRHCTSRLGFCNSPSGRISTGTRNFTIFAFLECLFNTKWLLSSLKTLLQCE